MDPATGIATEILPGTDRFNYPLLGYFSPDGTQMVFTRRINNVLDAIFVSNHDGTGSSLLVDVGVNESAATDWGEDGRIYYYSGQPADIYSLGSIGTLQLTSTGYEDSAPDLWHP